MGNRFTHVPFQEYTSFYDKIPYQQIAEVGAYKDKQFNEGQQAVSEFENLLNVPSLDADTPIKQQRVKYYEDELQKTLDNTKGDYSSIIPTVARLKRELGKDLRDGELGAVAGNYSQDSEYVKRLNELVDKKVISQEKASKLLEVNRANYKGIGQKNNLGRFSGYGTIAPANDVNVSEELDKMAKDWKASAVSSGSYKFSPDGKYIIKTDGSNEVVSDEEIFRNITASAKTNPEIMGFLKQQTMLDTYGRGQEQPEGYTIGSNSYASKADFDSLYTDELLNTPARMVASKYGYSKISSNADIKADSYGLQRSKQELENPISSSQLDTGEYDPVLSNPVIQGSTNWFDQNGNLQAERTYTGPDTKLTGPGEKAFNAYAKRRGIDLPKSNTTVQNPDFAQQKAIVEGLRKNAPNATKGMTDKQVMELHVQSLGESGQISYNSFQLQGLNPESTSKFVSSNLAGKKFMIDGDLQAMTFEQMAENLGLDNEELRKEVEKSKTVGIKPSSPNNPGAFKVQVFDGDGKPKSITIEGNKTQQDFFREYDNLMSLDKASTPGEVHTNNYYAKTEQTEVQTPEGYKVQFGTIIHPLSQSTASLEDIKSTYGSLENAKSQGITFVPVGKGTYKLVLDKQSINPQELGQSLVDRFKLEKMKDLHNKQKKSVDYTDTEE